MSEMDAMIKHVTSLVTGLKGLKWTGRRKRTFKEQPPDLFD